RWLTIGSANLSDHSLFNDTELNVCAAVRALDRRATPTSTGAQLACNATPASPPGPITSSATRRTSTVTPPPSSIAGGVRSQTTSFTATATVDRSPTD